MHVTKTQISFFHTHRHLLKIMHTIPISPNVPGFLMSIGCCVACCAQYLNEEIIVRIGHFTPRIHIFLTQISSQQYFTFQSNLHSSTALSLSYSDHGLRKKIKSDYLSKAVYIINNSSE